MVVMESDWFLLCLVKLLTVSLSLLVFPTCIEFLWAAHRRSLLVEIDLKKGVV